ncbi:bacillithiol biosynthesis deacetylase BshB1 [Alkalicoccus luteus]|uniref:Bacillithiol biosynthesis deacetylase BshB1 n=1 Tax=Alkalicoccus luteus TaxID=1237094 RepID=A0A969Q0J2_9BACI|nr:bacillithiol biosynthesis deacetylase BshB1 [Alkalicoccus luteus]NJP38912.1 bacillithiol biosynthesis deacetylase BshB1 [Alkalicoccus luteus]
MTDTILCIGAHPDDIEIGMGGTAAKLSAAGTEVVFVSLTAAELSSNGNPELRAREASAAADVLGVKTSHILSFADRGLRLDERDVHDEIVRLIRAWRPRWLFAPSAADRHPDHRHCSDIVREAFFTSGIHRYAEEAAYRPENLFYYQINGPGNPQTAVDITRWADRKYEALDCYRSQFEKMEGGVPTPLTNGYMEDVKARDRLTGREAGVTFAEGFTAEKLPLFSTGADLS